MTGREMAECVAAWMRGQGVDMSGPRVWFASPRGELWHVYALYDAAKEWCAAHPDAVRETEPWPERAKGAA